MSRSLRRKLRQIDRSRILSAEERIQHILDDRTERLAARAQAHAAPAAEAPRVLACGAGREHFGIPIEAVAEVLPYRECVPVPDGPAALIGLFGRSGRLVSVIDLAMALGLEPAVADEQPWHLVLLRGEHPQIALRVDQAIAVTDIVPLAGEEAGGFRTEAVSGYARPGSGFADQDRVLSVLDIARLLRPFLPSSPASGV
jgi:purine-binding chemotaxis protein CheW